MAKGVKHYKRDGTEYTGGSHKMPDGSLHSGKTHGKTSVPLFHFDDLSKTAKEKACLLYTSPSPRDGLLSRMPSSA